jgi:hypothetical protein
MVLDPTLSSNNRIAAWLAIVITAVWAISFLVDIVIKTYDPPASVHALMMLAAGAIFGEGLLKRNREPAPKKENNGTGTD